MWQRFTERARRVIFFAQEEAERAGNNYVSTEDILHGLTREDDNMASRLLNRMGISVDTIRFEIERQSARGEARAGQDMQLTPRAKRVIDLSYDEAQELANDYIGTEHLLIGLIREEAGLAGRILSQLGVTLERTRQELEQLKASEPPKSSGDPLPPRKNRVQSPAGSPVLQAVNAINTYTYGLDTSNWPLAVSKFADTIDVDYSAVNGPKSTLTRDELQHFLQQLLEQPDLRVHTTLGQLLSNPIDLDEFIVYYTVRHFKGQLGQTETFTVYGWYTYQLSGDLVTALTINVSAMEGNPALLGPQS